MRKSGLLARKGLGGVGGKGCVRTGRNWAGGSRLMARYGLRMFSNMVSPTDNMMSPVTAKLNNAKKMHFKK